MPSSCSLLLPPHLRRLPWGDAAPAPLSLNVTFRGLRDLARPRRVAGILPSGAGTSRATAPRSSFQQGQMKLLMNAQPAKGIRGKLHCLILRAGASGGLSSRVATGLS